MSEQLRSVLVSRELISTSAAAIEIGISPKTIRNYIAKGLLPAQRVGPRNFRVDIEDVRALVVEVHPQQAA